MSELAGGEAPPKDRLPHRQMTPESGKELIMLFLVLGLIVASMMFFRQQWRDPGGESEREWYYKHVDRKSGHGVSPSHLNR